MRVLVTGGVRSGKSRHAEDLLAGREDVTYIAPGRTAAEEPDPDWVARIRAHQERRPAGWRTIETRDLAPALSGSGTPVLVDCLGTWLSGLLDAHDAWQRPEEEVRRLVWDQTDRTAAALGELDDWVVVTNEVGLGIVPAYRSGRLFRDLLGTVNQRIAAVSDEVHLVVAGRTLVL